MVGSWSTDIFGSSNAKMGDEGSRERCADMKVVVVVVVSSS